MSLQARGWPAESALQERVAELAVATLGRPRIHPDTPLLSAGDGFDSFSLVEFVLRLESTFGIKIPDEDLDPDVFHSVRTVADYIAARLDQGR